MYALYSERVKKIYIGSTGNLRKRVREHREGRGGEFTKDNGPWELIFFEGYREKIDALRAERFFKTGYGREVLQEKLESCLSKRRQ
ncbi:MAG: GIY-YIG nuclease family protein [Candidatus Kerfeldbacteria bacterium]|nr:GIY-YIG nuclease family protein [Candidatus Kerfeldbacteria bacterium]